MSGNINIGGRMERLPLSSFQWRMFALLGIGMFFDGYDLFISSFVIPPLKEIGWLNSNSMVYFISVPLVAAAFGSVAAGILGDRIGRRRLFQGNVVAYGIGSVLCAVAPNVELLLAARSFTMFALGMQIVTGYSYMNEMTSRAVRGRFQSGVSLLVNGGLPVAALAAGLVIPNAALDMGWRLLFALSVFPTLLVFLNQRSLPESPRWLASVGREAEADAVMRGIEEEVERKHGPLPTAIVAPQPARDLGWLSLIAPNTRSRFLVAVAFSICQFCGIYILANWLPSILIAHGMTFLKSFMFSAATFAGAIAGPLIAIAISDRFERRNVVLGATTIAGLAGMVYALQTTEAGLLVSGFVLVACVYFLSSVGLATYLPEILPTGVRLRGLGSAFLIGRLASAASPFAVAALLPVVSDPLVIVSIVGLLYLIMAVVIGLFGPVTAGKSLEMLETELNTSGEKSDSLVGLNRRVEAGL
ncbi:MAG TPA: MFS transporter [Afipia sp.]